MKKLISIFISVIILLTSISMITFAEEIPALEIVTTESTYKGNPSTDIKFYLNNANNVATATCTIEYDSDMMAISEVYRITNDDVETKKFPPVLEKIKPGEIIIKLNDTDNCEQKEFSRMHITPKKDGKTTISITDLKAYDVDGNEIDVEMPVSSAELSFTIDIEFSFNEETKTLYINGQGTLPNYSLTDEYELYSLAPYAEYVNEIEHVVIGEGIVGIGKFEFTDSVKTVKFPDSLESMGLTDLSVSGDQVWYGKAFSIVEIYASLAKEGIPRGSKNISFIATDVYINGDLNKNDVVDASDALLILKIIAKMCDESGCLFTPDVNKDDSVTAEDALTVLKMAARLI